MSIKLYLVYSIVKFKNFCNFRDAMTNYSLYHRDRELSKYVLFSQISRQTFYYRQKKTKKQKRLSDPRRTPLSIHSQTTLTLRLIGW